MIENTKSSKALVKTDVSGSNETLYSKCCREQPICIKKNDVEYYECPYCKEKCDVEWMEDEFPDYCH